MFVFLIAQSRVGHNPKKMVSCGATATTPRLFCHDRLQPTATGSPPINGDPDSAGSSVRRASTRQTAGSRILSTGRLKQGTAKNLLRHRTAQAGDGMHAEHGRIPSRRHRRCFFGLNTALWCTALWCTLHGWSQKNSVLTG